MNDDADNAQGQVQHHLEFALGIIRQRGAVPRHQGREFCTECGETIPHARRVALQGVERCVDCQEQAEMLLARYRGI